MIDFIQRWVVQVDYFPALVSRRQKKGGSMGEKTLMRERIRIFFLASLCLVCLFQGCQKGPSEKELVRVNDVSISLEEFREITERQSLEGKLRLLKEKDRRDFLENYLITREVLYQEASKKGYDKNKQILAKIDDIKRAMVIDAFLEDTLSKKGDVSDNEIQRYYREHKDLFTEPEEIKFRQIIVESEPMMQEVLVKLARGESFEKLASTYNVGKYREDGGNFGSIRRGQLSPVLAQFEEVAFSLRNKGEISEVIKTPFGYHIIRLDDKRGTALKPLSLVKERIRQVLESEKKQAARTAFVKEAKTRATIFINEELWGKEEKQELKPGGEKKTVKPEEDKTR
jgi:peptidyl-prolyl cis-trans isomerase C